jgi:hypothetical protein
MGISLSAGKHVYTNEDLNQYKKSYLELNKNKELAICPQLLHNNSKSNWAKIGFIRGDKGHD